MSIVTKVITYVQWHNQDLFWGCYEFQKIILTHFILLGTFYLEKKNGK